MNILQKLRELLFTTYKPLPAGSYHYQAPPDSPLPYRLHLRLEPDGHGLLILNAQTVLHLNHTAAEYAYYLVTKTPEEKVAELMAKRFRVKKDQALSDYHDLIERIQILVETPDLDPETFLGFDRNDPYAVSISAPYRLDCALTYKVADSAGGPVAPVERVKRELLTEEWKTILKKAWDAGIPHVIFTGGEPTLRPDLLDLIGYGEELGMVTGVLTDGLRLAESKYLHSLLQSGLDHLMIVLDPENEQSWEAVRDVMTEDIQATIHLTVTQKIFNSVDGLLDRLKSMGVLKISLSIDNLENKEMIKAARQSAAERGLNLVWDLPVPYSRFHPAALEQDDDEKRIDGAGKAWLYVEPDGDVIRGQGLPEPVLGNLLSDNWKKIWKPD
jgi:MoaA/NifB/PqqE/SkfB family radical SAM enzyme